MHEGALTARNLVDAKSVSHTIPTVADSRQQQHDVVQDNTRVTLQRASTRLYNRGATAGCARTIPTPTLDDAQGAHHAIPADADARQHTRDAVQNSWRVIPNNELEETQHRGHNDLDDGTTGEEASTYLTFVAQAQAQPCPLGLNSAQKSGSAEAVEWLAARSSEEVRRTREQVVAEVERAGKALREAGTCNEWMKRADKETIRIAKYVNGPLGEMLVKATGFPDTEVMNVFRDGGNIAGLLHAPHGSTDKTFPAPTPTHTIKSCCEANNRALLASLKEDPNSDFLMEQTLQDAEAGRMTAPCRATDSSLKDRVLCRRFSRDQGTKKDGTPKLRAVDDESACGTNSTSEPTAKLHCDSADELVRTALLLQLLTGETPHFWKADVDKAFRRVPVAPEHRWLLYVAFTHQGESWVSGHNAMPVGSIASVHQWDRIGAFLRHLARTLLRLPVSRYVDDFFAVDRPQDVEHALSCFARLARAVLGEDALAHDKLEHGMPLDILGLQFEASANGINVQVNEAKAQKWLRDIEQYLGGHKLSPGQASKLAGRLSFASQHTFKRLGRAMLRPMFQQAHAPLAGNRIGVELALALRWWKQVLALRLSQTIPAQLALQTVELFTNARGDPPRLAAVLFDDSGIAYEQRSKKVIVRISFFSK